MMTFAQFMAKAKELGLMTNEIERVPGKLIGWNVSIDHVLADALIGMLSEAKGRGDFEKRPKRIGLELATAIRAFQPR